MGAGVFSVACLCVFQRPASVLTGTRAPRVCTQVGVGAGMLCSCVNVSVCICAPLLVSWSLSCACLFVGEPLWHRLGTWVRVAMCLDVCKDVCVDMRSSAHEPA